MVCVSRLLIRIGIRGKSVCLWYREIGYGAGFKEWVKAKLPSTMVRSARSRVEVTFKKDRCFTQRMDGSLRFVRSSISKGLPNPDVTLSSSIKDQHVPQSSDDATSQAFTQILDVLPIPNARARPSYRSNILDCPQSNEAGFLALRIKAHLSCLALSHRAIAK